MSTSACEAPGMLSSVNEASVGASPAGTARGAGAGMRGPSSPFIPLRATLPARLVTQKVSIPVVPLPITGTEMSQTST
ncbi:hypothetical protein ASNO1_47820 [Corallococcus caeni]|uniref:Uncharacterized protein n=1 Tax=Corallococcus caeni TaxID=3082388 RepID=A0ABQ6QWY5_9BACT|nr:hypothetical protein ASNO1_47820 [Corallococcus sp. NO1]